MTKQEASGEGEESKTKSWWSDLRQAGLFWLSIFAIGLVLGYGYLIFHNRAFYAAQLGGTDFAPLGQFGDAFGALTSLFNALAFAAVVATVVLQIRELRESREHLEDQAEAQKAWADAANQQIALTKRLEAVRIRPFIKAEWHNINDHPHAFEYGVRNVGLGVAIVDSVAPTVDGEVIGEISSHRDAARIKAVGIWHSCIQKTAANAGQFSSEIVPMQFDDHNRALAPSEYQALVRFSITGNAQHAARDLVREHVRATINFRSANGEHWTTENQFDSLVAES